MGTGLNGRLKPAYYLTLTKQILYQETGWRADFESKLFRERWM